VVVDQRFAGPFEGQGSQAVQAGLDGQMTVADRGQQLLQILWGHGFPVCPEEARTI